MIKIKLTVLACILIVGCSKKDEGIDLIKRLSSEAWIIKSISVTPPLPIIGSDYFNSFDPCSKDDLLVLSSDYTYERKEGASRCNKSDPEVYESGNWKLEGENTKLVFTSSRGVKEEYRMEFGMANELILEINQNLKIDYLYRITYLHQ
jgi:hypothetical protein